MLALKSTTTDKTDDSYWSEYVSFVLYTMPLLFFTVALYVFLLIVDTIGSNMDMKSKS